MKKMTEVKKMKKNDSGQPVTTTQLFRLQLFKTEKQTAATSS